MQLGKEEARRISEMTLSEKLGQMFVTGFPAEEMDESFRALVKDKKVGNVILFKDNLKSAEQSVGLSRDIRALIYGETGEYPLLTVDEEGGVVSRLPESMGKMPSAMALSALHEPDEIYQAARMSGKQLCALGMNFNLAPVLDVNSNAANPVIGIRSYGRNPQDAWFYASQAMRGYLDAGVMCSGKHFPGHGDVTSDSHLELPVSAKSLDELRQTELVPFEQAIRAHIPAVTIAHVVYSQLDDVPATMSRKIVTDLLRTELGFDGLIISDCMEMNAISTTYGIEEGVIRAVLAGIELIFISHKHDKVRSAMDALEQAVEQGRVPMEMIDAAVARILHYKREYARTEPIMDAEVFRACGSLAENLFEKTIYAEKPFKLGGNPCFISPCQTQVSQVSNASGTLCFAREMQKHFGGSCVELPLKPDAQAAAEAVEAAKGASSVVVGTLNATVYKGQMDILEELEKLGVPMACVTFRNPFELDRLSDSVYKLTAWEYSKRSVERAEEFFTK